MSHELLECRHAGRAAIAGVLAVVVTSLLIGCGKKGPPLPPLQGMVPRVTDLATTQIGRDVHASFTLPLRPQRQDIDYAPVAIELWRKDLTEASEPTFTPSREMPLPRPRTSGSAPPFASQSFGGGMSSQADNGPPVDEYTKDAKLVASLSGDALLEALRSPPLDLVDTLPDAPPAPFLEYAIVLKSDIRKRGTVSNATTLEPVEALVAPSGLKADVKEGAIELSWKAPPPPAKEATEAPATEEPPGEGAAAESGDKGEKPPPEPTHGFNVYRATGDLPFPALPLNGRPLSTPSLVDKELEIGTTYRYIVRSVLATESATIESASSDAVAITYTDSFPPKPPEGLRLILEGRRSVTLLWNPNGEADLAGYAAYRRETGGTWQRIDAGVSRTATFSDGGVAPGRTYEYVVSAYDAAIPSNESERSAPEHIAIPAEVP